MNDIDFVLFDADNTLFDYDRAEDYALGSAIAEFGIPFTDEIRDTYRRINAEYWDAFEQGTVSASELRVGRFADLADVLGLCTDGDALGARYLTFLAQASFLIDHAQEVVEELHGKGYTLGLITNGLEEVQRGRLAGSPLTRYFASVTISDEVGAKKPEARIFEIAFERSGAPAAGRSLMVGDSLTSDIAGGSAFGMRTCWYNPRGEALPPWDDPRRPTPDYVIARLPELPALLGPTP